MVDSTNLPNVDINQIATDLNGKADTDLTNTTNTGYIKMAKASMPSDKYIDLTLGASGSSYVAPADGWVTNEVRVASVGTGCILRTTTTDGSNMYIRSVSSLSNQLVASILPVKKGRTFIYEYGTPATTNPRNVLRFIYAVGSESEAS